MPYFPFIKSFVPRRLDRTLLLIMYFTVLFLTFITLPCIIVGTMQGNENSYVGGDSIVGRGIFIFQIPQLDSMDSP